MSTSISTIQLFTAFPLILHPVCFQWSLGMKEHRTAVFRQFSQIPNAGLVYPALSLLRAFKCLRLRSFVQRTHQQKKADVLFLHISSILREKSDITWRKQIKICLDTITIAWAMSFLQQAAKMFKTQICKTEVTCTDILFSFTCHNDHRKNTAMNSCFQTFNINLRWRHSLEGISCHYRLST